VLCHEWLHLYAAFSLLFVWYSVRYWLSCWHIKLIHCLFISNYFKCIVICKWSRCMIASFIWFSCVTFLDVLLLSFLHFLLCWARQCLIVEEIASNSPIRSHCFGMFIMSSWTENNYFRLGTFQQLSLLLQCTFLLCIMWIRYIGLCCVNWCCWHCFYKEIRDEKVLT